MRCKSFLSIWLLAAVCAAILSGQNGLAAEKSNDPLDWPYWRGPEQNGISRETGLPDKWDHRGGPGSKVSWVRKDLGGRSTPIVMKRPASETLRNRCVRGLIRAAVTVHQPREA